MKNKTLVILAVLALASASASADSTITVGTQYIGENTPGQVVRLYVSGTDAVSGFDLRAQIGDGIGGSGEPVFQAVSFSGGIWDAYADTAIGGPVSAARQFAQASVAFNTPVSVPASGLLVTLTVDTTGFARGTSFPLLLKSTQIGADSDFVIIGGSTLQPTITNGTLVILRSGDANHDAKVDDNDLNVLLSNWHTGTDWSHGNFKGSGTVDDNDLNMLLSNWAGSGAATASPEPTTLFLLALGGLGLMRRRKWVVETTATAKSLLSTSFGRRG